MADSANSPFVQGRIEYAHKCIEQAKAAKPFVEDAAQNRKAYVLEGGAGPTMVHHCDTPDLSVDDWKKFSDNYLAMVSEFIKDDGKITMEKIEDLDDGRILIHQHLKPGVPLVSNRSIMAQTYNVKSAEGEHTFILSSVDSAAFNEKHKALIGKNVIGTLEVNFWHFKPMADGKGTHATHVSSSNPNGSIPNMLVNKMAQRQADALLGMATMLRAKK